MSARAPQSTPLRPRASASEADGPAALTFWIQRDDAPRGAPALFLDRDGVLVREVGYLHEAGGVEVLAGAAGLVAEARRRGFAVGVVSNQSGVGRGFYGWRDFAGVNEEIGRRLGEGGEPFAFDFVAACGAHAQAQHPHMRAEAHPWRKPGAGMLLHAAEALDLDLPASVMVGDQAGDVRAGLAAGVGRCVHLLTGHGGEHREEVLALGAQARGRVLTADDLPGAAAVLGWAAERQAYA